MKYGISSKDYSKFDYYIKKFETEDEALEWLNTEEYDFRMRELYDSLEELIKDNVFVQEAWDDYIECDIDPTIENYVAWISEYLELQDEC